MDHSRWDIPADEDRSFDWIGVSCEGSGRRSTLTTTVRAAGFWLCQTLSQGYLHRSESLHAEKALLHDRGNRQRGREKMGEMVVVEGVRSELLGRRQDRDTSSEVDTSMISTEVFSPATETCNSC